MQSTENERWLPVVGYEGIYEVSDHGRVKSLARVIIASNGQRRPVRERILKAAPRPRHHLNLHRDGICANRYVHHLVLEAFVGPRPEGMEACHWDDDPDNNNLSNLRWDTHSENSRDKIRNGNDPRSSKTHCIYGHVLADPNLLQGRKPWRGCLACSRAHGILRHRGSTFDPAVADAYYREIMSAVDATDGL